MFPSVVTGQSKRQLRQLYGDTDLELCWWIDSARFCDLAQWLVWLIEFRGAVHAAWLTQSHLQVHELISSRCKHNLGSKMRNTCCSPENSICKCTSRIRGVIYQVFGMGLVTHIFGAISTIATSRGRPFIFLEAWLFVSISAANVTFDMVCVDRIRCDQHD